MAQSGYTPILIYASSTPGALPSAGDLTSGASGAELAINYADGKLYFKNSSGVVTLLAGSSSGPAGGSNTQVQYNSSGVLAGSSNLTFDGTSLTLGGNPTLSAGTANGVLYLNGSKVATSGSALSFDGTTLTLTGNQNIDGTTGDFLRFRGSTVGVSGGVTASIGYIGTYTNHDFAFATSNTEQMRLTSTGLGIGTSSPTGKLDVAGSVGTFRIETSGARLEFTRDDANYIRYGSTNGLLIFEQGATERMRLDSSGNLGLGVTPSAWGLSGAKAAQVINAAFWGYLNNAYVSANNFNDGTGNKYIATGFATRYEQSSGAHVWQTAPSGTAGNAITFTQAMTLDASGNLGLGETSPYSLSNYGAMTIRGSVGGLTMYRAGATNIGYIGGNNSDELFIANLRSSGYITLSTNSTERARITSGGDLLVGTTSTGFTNSNSVTIQPSSGFEIINHENGSSSGTTYLGFGYNGSAIGSVSQNGTTGVLYNITSDYRLKNVIGSVTGSGERIDALEPVDYTWKADGSTARGFLAHKFQEVYPNSVIGNKDAVDDKGEPIYQAMQASSSEVIADLVAEIQSLRQRVALLEGN